MVFFAHMKVDVGHGSEYQAFDAPSVELVRGCHMQTPQMWPKGSQSYKLGPCIWAWGLSL